MEKCKRFRNRWTIKECLDLQREFELLKLSIDEIALRHKRTPNAIMLKLDEQNFADLQNEQQKNMLQIAIIGRPNAGKSSLLNHILQQDRLLTGPEAGITRDSISVDWQINGNPVRFIDTAGIRKKTNIPKKKKKLFLPEYPKLFKILYK